ncbi:hypothetical protein CVIRNUC_006091 [Coccomyxa viridis]|uniref:Uncharacterized protein n=1 Tax=Coccomyxa viridis TaxID=1274662 RepID=A0AAV1I6B1_9CHLO|nr:hypothetical protein CVIRNUC_006091 [Coccomyxa viridis]
MQNRLSILHQWAPAPFSLPNARALESRAPPKWCKRPKLAKPAASPPDRHSGTQTTCALHDVGGLRTQRLPSEADDEKYGLLVSSDAAVQAGMLGAVFASQRLRMFSAAIVQHCMGQEFLQRATSPSQAHNELQEPQTHAKTAVDEATSQATAASPTLQHAQMRTSTSATAAAESLPASSSQLNDVLARQPGSETCSASPPACSAAAALTAEGRQQAQHSVSMLKETVDRLGSTLQNAQAALQHFQALLDGEPQLAGQIGNEQIKTRAASQVLWAKRRELSGLIKELDSRLHGSNASSASVPDADTRGLSELTSAAEACAAETEAFLHVAEFTIKEARGRVLYRQPWPQSRPGGA